MYLGSGTLVSNQKSDRTWVITAGHCIGNTESGEIERMNRVRIRCPVLPHYNEIEKPHARFKSDDNRFINYYVSKEDLFIYPFYYNDKNCRNGTDLGMILLQESYHSKTDALDVTKIWVHDVVATETNHRQKMNRTCSVLPPELEIYAKLIQMDIDEKDVKLEMKRDGVDVEQFNEIYNFVHALRPELRKYAKMRIMGFSEIEVTERMKIDGWTKSDKQRIKDFMNCIIDGVSEDLKPYYDLVKDGIVSDNFVEDQMKLKIIDHEERFKNEILYHQKIEMFKLHFCRIVPQIDLTLGVYKVLVNKIYSSQDMERKSITNQKILKDETVQITHIQINSKMDTICGRLSNGDWVPIYDLDTNKRTLEKILSDKNKKEKEWKALLQSKESILKMNYWKMELNGV